MQSINRTDPFLVCSDVHIDVGARLRARLSEVVATRNKSQKCFEKLTRIPLIAVSK